MNKVNSQVFVSIFETINVVYCRQENGGVVICSVNKPRHLRGEWPERGTMFLSQWDSVSKLLDHTIATRTGKYTEPHIPYIFSFILRQFDEKLKHLFMEMKVEMCKSFIPL